MPIRDWRELKYLVEQKQKGYDIDSPEADTIAKYSAMSDEDRKRTDVYLDAYLNSDTRTRYAEQDQAMRDYGRYTSDIANSDVFKDTDYGTYGKDSDVPFETWIKDPVNYRANAQSGWAKFGNGVAKLVPYAATTFLDNTVGLIGAITNVAIDVNNNTKFPTKIIEKGAIGRSVLALL